MRPQGEIRQALLTAAEQLQAQQGCFSWHDLAERAQVGYLAARRTVENMARAGALEGVGQEKRAHSRRWVALYALPELAVLHRDNERAAGATGLASVVRGWCS